MVAAIEDATLVSERPNSYCPGRMVDVRPFGGFNMSGTESKAGGRDYLLLYTQAKAVSETM